MNKSAEPTKKELFIFVFIWVAILLTLAFYPMAKGNEPRIWAAAISLAFIIMLFLPKLLVPVYHLWVKFGSTLGKINSYIILNLLFYFIITPMGMAMRLFGKDLLNKKIDKNAKSYWSVHESNGSMENQF